MTRAHVIPGPTLADTVCLTGPQRRALFAIVIGDRLGRTVRNSKATSIAHPWNLTIAGTLEYALEKQAGLVRGRPQAGTDWHEVHFVLTPLGRLVVARFPKQWADEVDREVERLRALDDAARAESGA